MSDSGEAENHVGSSSPTFLEKKDSRRGVLKKALGFLGLAATASIPDLPPTVKTYTEAKPLTTTGKDYSKRVANPVPTRPLEPVYSNEETPQPPPQVVETENPVLIEERVLYPDELSYKEVLPWIGKMRNSHETILSEALFTWELAKLEETKRLKVIDAIAEAHAQALLNHYGDAEAIIGLDPGHGGSDIGSGSRGIAEKDLTWQTAELIAKKLFDKSKGKYTVVMLRPENPKDEDLDGDGNIAAIERIQKRKALLLKMEQEIRKNQPEKVGQDIAYVSIHFNGMDDENAKGTEVYWPNGMAMKSDKYREGSKNLAQIMQEKLLEGLKGVGYESIDRGAKEDPDTREPLDNSENSVGPYNVLSSPKLDRVLRKAI